MAYRINHFTIESKGNKKLLSTKWDTCSSPWGTIIVTATSKALCRLEIHEKEKAEKVMSSLNSCLKKKPGLAHETLKAYQQYIITRTPINLGLLLIGTPFQIKVWKTLLSIPVGETFTYSQIATKIGLPKAVRAVGTAIGKNPLALLIPCHQIIPKAGGVGQYAYGSSIKEALLQFENQYQ